MRKHGANAVPRSRRTRLNAETQLRIATLTTRQSPWRQTSLTTRNTLRRHSTPAPDQEYSVAALTRSQATPARNGRLSSIDVLRGGAALAVVFFHTTDGALFLDAFRSAPWLTILALPAAYGFSGVYLFFVISGFCIHLAWARERANNREPQVAFVPFWKRRIRRLYPPYLVALGIYLLLLWAEGTTHSMVRPAAWDIGLHLVMLHNLDPATALSINGVFWTLAIEEQLYLAYFLLLAIRRRFGWRLTLATCAAARIGWFGLAFLAHRIFGAQIPVTEAAASHWFTWALGAWSVEAWYGLVQRPRWTGQIALCAPVLLVGVGLSSAQHLLPPDSFLTDLAWLLEHPCWGLGFFILVNGLTAAESATTQDGAARSVAGARVWSALGAIGLFSYSLYLTHQLVLTHAVRVLSHEFAWSESASVLWQAFVLAPVSVVLAWVFYRLFERPFVTKVRPTPSDAVAADEPGNLTR